MSRCDSQEIEKRGLIEKQVKSTSDDDVCIGDEYFRMIAHWLLQVAPGPHQNTIKELAPG